MNETTTTTTTTTERLIHEAGLGELVVHLSAAGRPELVAPLIAHLHSYQKIKARLHELQQEQAEQRAVLPPAMREAQDLTLWRPCEELSRLLGVTQQTIVRSSTRPLGRYERTTVQVPGSNMRWLYRVKPSSSADDTAGASPSNDV